MKNLPKAVTKLVWLAYLAKILPLHNKIAIFIKQNLSKFYSAVSTFRSLKTVYDDLEEKVYRAVALELLYPGNSPLWCPVCMKEEKETPINFLFGENGSVVAVRCPQHGILCTVGEKFRFLPLLKILLENIDFGFTLPQGDILAIFDDARLSAYFGKESLGILRQEQKRVLSAIKYIRGLNELDIIKFILEILRDLLAAAHTILEEHTHVDVLPLVKQLRTVLKRYGDLCSRLIEYAQKFSVKDAEEIRKEVERGQSLFER